MAPRHRPIDPTDPVYKERTSAKTIGSLCHRQRSKRRRCKRRTGSPIPALNVTMTQSHQQTMDRMLCQPLIQSEILCQRPVLHSLMQGLSRCWDHAVRRSRLQQRTLCLTPRPFNDNLICQWFSCSPGDCSIGLKDWEMIWSPDNQQSPSSFTESLANLRSLLIKYPNTQSVVSSCLSDYSLKVINDLCPKVTKLAFVFPCDLERDFRSTDCLTSCLNLQENLTTLAISEVHDEVFIDLICRSLVNLTTLIVTSSAVSPGIHEEQPLSFCDAFSNCGPKLQHILMRFRRVRMSRDLFDLKKESKQNIRNLKTLHVQNMCSPIDVFVKDCLPHLPQIEDLSLSCVLETTYGLFCDGGILDFGNRCPALKRLSLFMDCIPTFRGNLCTLEHLLINGRGGVKFGMEDLSVWLRVAPNIRHLCVNGCSGDWAEEDLMQGFTKIQTIHLNRDSCCPV